MAQLARYLLHKLENLSSHTKSQTQTCVDGLHPRTREHRERQSAGVHRPASLELQVQRETLLQKIRWRLVVAFCL